LNSDYIKRVTKTSCTHAGTTAKEKAHWEGYRFFVSHFDKETTLFTTALFV
jgi:hypothetical protein